MSSRLDRLFLLLESGSTALTRKAAALQLGEVQRLHPHELHTLLHKVKQYLRSNSWDTRIAASQAVEAIVSNVPLWLPSGIKHESDQQNNQNDSVVNSTIGRMNFDKYDINTVIKCGHNLLASEGKEFDDFPDNSSDSSVVDLKEKIARQRQLLNQRLGLDVANKLGLQIDSNDFVTNSDLTNEEAGNETEAIDSTKKSAELDEILSKATGRSLKRKAQRLNRLKSIEQKMSYDENNSNDAKKSKSKTKSQIVLMLVMA